MVIATQPAALMNMMSIRPLQWFGSPASKFSTTRSCPRKIHLCAEGHIAYDTMIVQQVRNRDRGFPVADELDYEIYQDQKRLQRRRSRAPRVPLIVAVLAVIAAASAFGWLNYGRLVQPASSAPSPVAAAVARNTEETVALKDFQSFQQQTAQSLQSMDQGIAVQKADLTRLSDQLSALAARLDALQTAAAPAPPPAAPARPAVTAPRKRLPVERPAGRISVGGAPLPAAPPQDGR